MITILLLCNLAFLIISICVYANICNDLEWVSLKELFEVVKDVFDEADAVTAASMVTVGFCLLPSILISCLIIHIIYKAFSK